jgi:hypothetical protein
MPTCFICHKGHGNVQGNSWEPTLVMDVMAMAMYFMASGVVASQQIEHIASLRNAATSLRKWQAGRDASAITM